MTSHNSFFGWVHCLSWGNGFMGNSAQIYNTPYPPIIANPNINQVVQNWNLADTGMVLSTVVFSMLLTVRKHSRVSSSFIFQQRQNFRISVMASFAVGTLLGLRNSIYRLEGLVPNGLAPYEIEEPVKYNYRGPFLEKSILKPFFAESKKPIA